MITGSTRGTGCTVTYVLCFTAAVVDRVIRHAVLDRQGVFFLSWFVSQGVATVLNFLLQNF
ncbi:hypothetical protein ACT3SZ_02450 [Corynebacterium sp. AOP40-9SA-29]|uniref:hypothetical protein n=1 Tax=Corynebacterium sp. AOP40-9SA-29 TaxID=3457677 RepID=UPI0040342A62